MPTPLPQPLLAVVEAQAGVVALDQVRAAGLSWDHVRARVRSGRWRRLHPGVYLTHDGPPLRASMRWAALLYSGADALEPSHRCRALGPPRRADRRGTTCRRHRPEGPPGPPPVWTAAPLLQTGGGDPASVPHTSAYPSRGHSARPCGHLGAVPRSRCPGVQLLPAAADDTGSATRRPRGPSQRPVARASSDDPRRGRNGRAVATRTDLSAFGRTRTRPTSRHPAGPSANEFDQPGGRPLRRVPPRRGARRAARPRR